METFAQARARLMRELALLGWNMSIPSLKVPHATSPEGLGKIMLKPQAIYVQVPGEDRPRSLYSDMRGIPASRVVQELMDMAVRNVMNA